MPCTGVAARAISASVYVLFPAKKVPSMNFPLTLGATIFRPLGGLAAPGADFSAYWCLEVRGRRQHTVGKYYADPPARYVASEVRFLMNVKIIFLTRVTVVLL
jgi:hypothetical protein